MLAAIVMNVFHQPGFEQPVDRHTGHDCLVISNGLQMSQGGTGMQAAIVTSNGLQMSNCSQECYCN